ncbi:single-stranded-DNA-specific exonuclease RecJ [Cohnella sp. CFH 77786]|uniref:single-stranded-DNA-specific exonuclease RecJ n=1 Tax=Cohnella sp. CFH 77786 TaxID=2662265 RepID=UPI001C60EEC3|nr:single-stranded-DNA-specific exonuclease RecJ [Cohnella sp. CFH 77786]MBW5447903.1 single-stranded-DNA-specific exonuclease RecJ [Cohnella sp. CFH 77786]
MIPARYRWEWNQPDERLAREWAERLGIPLLASRVLVSRGFSEEEAAFFFRPADVEGLENPLLMKGMPEAAERIRRAIADGERIRVYGDYDADGVTSTALMIRLFGSLGANFDTYIPHRSLEGYGLNLPAVDAAAGAGISLIVTVDNGISAVEPIAYAREKGIDVVVTDHHEPPAILPDAVALVNPKQPDCDYPFKGLCGAGVAFKLAHVLLGRLPAELADLAAIGTVADLMPLTGENRTIVRMGLERMRKEPSAGIRALAGVCGTDPAELSSGRIGFGLAPRLNAGGRLERADGAVKLLTTDDAAEAERLARDLDRLNAERQKLVDATVLEAERMWQEKIAEFGGDGPNVIVLSKTGWNAGIAGLVASKLVERHYRPAVILAEDPDTGKCKGSARSIDGFDLYAALTECGDCLEHYGGHQAAAGMTLYAARIVELEEKLHRLTGEWLWPEDWQPKKRADLACELSETTLEAAEALSRLEPFGNGHPVPRVLVEGVTILESRTMGKENKHIRLKVGREGRTLEAVGFGFGDLAERLASGTKIDLLGELGVNEWNGTRRVQFTVQDLRCDELRWVDRRTIGRVWPEIVKLAEGSPEAVYVLCASALHAGEAASRPELRGAVICTYSDVSDGGGNIGTETAAATETVRSRRGAPSRARKLVLLGLPDNEQDVGQLERWVADPGGWESVYLFEARTGRERPALLDRANFARVYALLREQGSWIDGPEGALRRAADQAGLPLASVRLIQEVFVELGFIRVHGAERAIVADPPRRKLEESERYARMVRQAETAAFPDWPLEKLKEWAERIRSNTRWS